MKKNIFWALCGNIVPILFAVLSIPVLMLKLDNEDFGLLTIVWAAVGYVGFFDLGVGRALTREMASRGEDDDVNILVWTGLYFSIIVSLFVALALFFLRPYILDKFSNANNLEKFKLIYNYICIMLVPVALTTTQRGVMEGGRDFFTSNAVKTIIGGLSFLIPYVCIDNFNMSLSDAVWYYGVARFVIVLVIFIWILRKYELIFHMEWREARRIIRFGFWVTISSVISPLMVYGDRLFVGSIVGVDNISVYSISQEAVQRLIIFAAAVASVLLTAFSKNKISVVEREIYSKALAKMAIFMLIICICAAFLFAPVVEKWISYDFAEKSRDIILILLVGVFFNALAQVPYALVHGAGKTSATAIMHIVEAAIYFILLIKLVEIYGLVGAAVAWSVRAILDYFFLEFYARNRVLR